MCIVRIDCGGVMVQQDKKQLDVNCSICNKQKVLEHQLEEWKLLNEYINKMDMGYQQSFVLIVSIFAGIAAFLSSGILPKEWLRAIFIIPLGLVAVFAYLSYQFRITAILRGHLAALEEKMNRELDENVHMWNSALVEAFMANNNLINNTMMLPILFFIGLLIFYCAIFTWKALEGIPYAILIFVGYWLLIVFGIIIVLPPFIRNGIIRKVTYDEEKVLEMYQQYRSRWKNETECFTYKIKNFEFQAIKRKLLMESFIVGSLNLLFGFGAMYFLWKYTNVFFDVNGFFDYYAAVFGDGIFLTGVIGFGWYFIKINEIGLSARVEKGCKLFGIFAFFVGVLIQISWLLNKDIEPNWTIPQAHTFTLAGWYHACYFSIMFGIIAYLSLMAVYLNCTKTVESKVAYVCMWLSGIGYWYTHLIDDEINSDNYLMWIFYSITIILVAFCVLEWIPKARKENCLISYIVFFIGSGFLTISLVIFCNVGGLEWNVLDFLKNLNIFLKGSY